MKHILSKDELDLIIEKEKKNLIIFKIFALVIIIILTILSFFSAKQIVDMLIYATPKTIIFFKTLLELFFINIGFFVLDIILTTKNEYYKNLKLNNFSSYLTKITNKETKSQKYYIYTNLEKEIEILVSSQKYKKIEIGDEVILIINHSDKDDIHLYELYMLK